MEQVVTRESAMLVPESCIQQYGRQISATLTLRRDVNKVRCMIERKMSSSNTNQHQLLLSSDMITVISLHPQTQFSLPLFSTLKLSTGSEATKSEPRPDKQIVNFEAISK